MAGENLDLIGALADLEQERGIDRETLLSAVEAALISAYRRNYGTTENVGVRVDRDNGQMDIYVQKRIVDEVADPDQEIGIADARAFDPSYQTGDIIEFPVLVKDFGRIAAQTAKQVVVQRIREAERGMIFDEYVQREGDIITGVVQRVQGRTAFIDLGKAEAVLPAAEVPPGEYYNPGDRVKVYLVEVRRTNKGPQLLVSRTHPGLLKRLFELEVPEIHDGLVEVRGIAREAGARSKFAVFSRDDHIDPVGACVGHKGMRVQAVVNELRGEKIDIIKWSPDPMDYVGNALSPSKVSQVLLREEDKVARVIVPDYQLSLAIGRAGQNARLAAKLTGWRIDIRSESQVLEEGGELAPAGAGTATPAVPWAGAGGFGGAGGAGRGSPIAAPWAVSGPEAAEGAAEAGVEAGLEAGEGAEVLAAAEGGAAEAVVAAEAAEAAEAMEAGGAVEAAEAAEAAGAAEAMGAAETAETLGAAETIEAAAAMQAGAGGAAGAAGTEADGDRGDQGAALGEAGAEPGAVGGHRGPARPVSRRIAMAPATDRAKPKKKAPPKTKETERAVHAASLAEALAKAGLAQDEDGAAAGAGGTAPQDGAARTDADAAPAGKRGRGGRAAAGAGADGAGAGAGGVGQEAAARDDGDGPATAEAAAAGGAAGGAASGGKRGRGGAAAGRRGRATAGDGAEEPAGEAVGTAIDEETLEALEEQAARPQARQVRRVRRTRDEGSPLAREEE